MVSGDSPQEVAEVHLHYDENKKRPSKATKAAAPKGKRAALPGSEDERNRKVWEANDRFLTSGIKIKDVTDGWNP